MVNDRDILQAVRRTRDEWGSTLGAKEAEDLAKWLDKAVDDDPEAIRQATNRVLEILQKHPRALTGVRRELGVEEIEILRMYEPPPGGLDEVPAGTLMVCPVDPDHCRKRLRQKGQTLFCPEHGVALVPAGSVAPKE
jgi:hypothetical protein